jgi:plasmid stability protein
MGVNLSIKDVPEALAQRLRERAARNHRSLQGELMSIIERAALLEEPPAPPAKAANRAQTSREALVQGWQTIEQLMAERQASGWLPHPSLRHAPRAVDIVRADRDSR